MASAERGFTLIEVLVALAVFGVVAMALLSQTREQTRMAAGLEDRLLAHWVASNTLTDLQTSGGYPEPGSQETTAVMAGRDWFVTMRTSTTPSPDVRNLEILVAAYDPVADSKGSPLVTLTGFVGRTDPR